MKKQTTAQFVSNVIVNNRISIYRKIDIIGDVLFRYSTKQITTSFKEAKAIEFLKELHSLLYSPNYEIEELYGFDTGSIYLLDRDYELINQVAEILNTKYENYIMSRIVQSKYQSLFDSYAENISPSHRNRGKLTHEEVSKKKQFLAELKESNPQVFSKIRLLAIKRNTSIDLLMYVFASIMKLDKITNDIVQLNMKTDEIIILMRQYCEITNQEYYSDEYNKASLIRSIAYELVGLFFPEYKVISNNYIPFKLHARLLLIKKVTSKVQNQYILYILHNVIFNNIYLHKYYFNYYNVNNINKTNYISYKKRKPPGITHYEFLKYKSLYKYMKEE